MIFYDSMDCFTAFAMTIGRVSLQEAVFLYGVVFRSSLREAKPRGNPFLKSQDSAESHCDSMFYKNIYDFMDCFGFL